MSTHDVVNQSPPRVGVNEFTGNVPLADAVRHYDAGWAIPELEQVGALVGAAEFQHDAELANSVTPVLKAFDRYGNRLDEVEYHPAYHRIIAEAAKRGAHTSAWAGPRPGANVARAATFMLFAQVEPGHACPISMTHSVVPALAAAPELRESWLPRLLSRDYDGTLTAGKSSALIGMAMTEKQGGSDVRANTTTAAVATGGGRSPSPFRVRCWHEPRRPRSRMRSSERGWGKTEALSTGCSRPEQTWGRSWLVTEKSRRQGRRAGTVLTEKLPKGGGVRHPTCLA